MMFYSFFVERWIAATQGMTPLQECMYLRLTNWMYVNECALPPELKECGRIARIEGKPDLDAVAWVLGRLFTWTEAGYVQAKAMHEIARFQAGEPNRQARRQLDKERKQHTRTEQQRLYGLAREKGLQTRARMRLNELRELVGEPVVRMVKGSNNFQASTEASAADASESPQVCHPRPMTHYVLTDVLQPADAGAAAPPRVVGESGLEQVPDAAQVTPERVAAAVRALKSGGLIGINGSHPMLLECLRAGVSDETLTWAASAAVAKGKPFAYAVAIVEGQMRDAAASAAGGLAPAAVQDRNRVSEWAPGLQARQRW